MDVPRVLAELRAFESLTTLMDTPRDSVLIGADIRETAGPERSIVAAAQVVEKILDRVLPAWRASIPFDKTGRWQQHHEAALRAIAQLTRQAEIDEMLGDDAPRMSASTLHPWAWDGARSLWQSGHRREAVRAASVKVNAETQNKLGARNLSETALFRMAFRSDPPANGKPRLRLPEDDDGQTAQSMRRGMMAFAEGCYAAIRNPASHDPLEELGEQEALEQLASFSVLARWVDRARVER